MGSKSAPAAPDYRGAAAEQGAASEKVNMQQTWANRPTINTPWGQQSWNASVGVDPASGQNVTKWESNVSLSPEQQAALDSQQAIQQGRSEAAQGLLGQATEAFNNPMNWDNLPQLAQPGGGAWRDKAQQAVTDFRKPLQDRRQGQLETQLANMGLSRGSEAWKSEMQTLQDQFARDDLQALDSGRQEAALGNQTALAQNQTRQQAIAEGGLERSQRLNELNALLTGQQVAMPTMPNFNPAGAAQAAPIMQGAQLAGQASLDAFNAEQGARTGTMAGLGSLGALAYMAFSDERLKKDISFIAKLASGIKLYSYRYKWDRPGTRRVGVLAQEVRKILPQAVVTHPSGYLMVDYSKLEVA